jgi:catechol 2,3-dioxygenase-like lactoylglutathione lyase family enzyme
VRLAQVVLFVHDVAGMAAFYCQALGLETVEDSPGWVRLAAGDVVLGLHAVSGPAPAAPAAPRADACVKLCFHSDDVDAARAALLARGVPMRDVVRFGAVAFCDGVDPEGNVFQLTSR